MQTHIVFGPLHPLCVFLILLINRSQSLSSSVPSFLVTPTLHRVIICIYFFYVLVYFSVFQLGCMPFCLSPISELCVVVCVYRCQSLASLPFSRGSVSDPDELCCFSKELDWLKINPLVFTLLTNSVSSPGDY